MRRGHKREEEKKRRKDSPKMRLLDLKPRRLHQVLHPLLVENPLQQHNAVLVKSGESAFRYGELVGRSLEAGDGVGKGEVKFLGEVGGIEMGWRGLDRGGQQLTIADDGGVLLLSLGKEGEKKKNRDAERKRKITKGTGASCFASCLSTWQRATNSRMNKSNQMTRNQSKARQWRLARLRKGKKIGCPTSRRGYDNA